MICRRVIVFNMTISPDIDLTIRCKKTRVGFDLMSVDHPETLQPAMDYLAGMGSHYPSRRDIRQAITHSLNLQRTAT